MRHAVYCANFGRLGDARLLVELALRAEQAGWDGFFLYDHVVVAPGRAVPSVDPWTVLAAVASRTGLWIGPMVTPLARRQPWEVAHQAVAVDALSGGRFVLGAGLGEPMDHRSFGLPEQPRAQAERLDEALALVRRLWAGETVMHSGHWRLDGVALAPAPVRGTIPIWIAGRYGFERPLRRAARHDGFFPINREWDLDALLEAARLAELADAVAAERGGLAGFDLVTAGISPADAGAAEETIAPHRAAGATWWLEVIQPRRGDLEVLRRRIEAGPPR